MLPRHPELPNPDKMGEKEVPEVPRGTWGGGIAGAV